LLAMRGKAGGVKVSGTYRLGKRNEVGFSSYCPETSLTEERNGGDLGLHAEYGKGGHNSRETGRNASAAGLRRIILFKKGHRE